MLFEVFSVIFIALVSSPMNKKLHAKKDGGTDILKLISAPLLI